MSDKKKTPDLVSRYTERLGSKKRPGSDLVSRFADKFRADMQATRGGAAPPTAAETPPPAGSDSSTTRNGGSGRGAGRRSGQTLIEAAARSWTAGAPVAPPQPSIPVPAAVPGAMPAGASAAAADSAVPTPASGSTTPLPEAIPDPAPLSVSRREAISLQPSTGPAFPQISRSPNVRPSLAALSNRAQPGGGGRGRAAAETATADPVANPVPDPEVVTRRALSRRVTIDFTRLEKMGYLTPTAVKSHMAEQYRLIKRPLLKKAFMKGDDEIVNGTVIMVTSPHDGEGKSFTAINLAISVAQERDLYVLLIDSDIYTQSILKVLNLEGKRGLSDLLLDSSVQMPEVILRTNIPNLSILPAGQKHGNATELLASHRMRELTDDLVSRYPDRVIIIDTPAVLHNTEPSVMAGYVGQVLIVVEYNKTSWKDLEKTVTMLTACTQLNFIINKADGPSGNTAVL